MSGNYRVYKDAGNYITVEADSALEALKRCGLQNVYRIERDAIYLTNVLNVGALLSNPPPAAAVVAAEAPAAAPAAPTPPTAEAQASSAPAAEAPVADAPAADVPLSTSDVDKLLQGNQ